MYFKCIIILIVISYVSAEKFKFRRHKEENETVQEEQKLNTIQPQSSPNCSIKFDGSTVYESLEELDAKNKEVINKFHNSREKSFDTALKQFFIIYRGVAPRETHKVGDDVRLIPAGINLGGYCLVKFKTEVFFFHRMKLRNDTYFQLRVLHSDFKNMVLHCAITLNDLHLFGSYTLSRNYYDRDRSSYYFYFSPNYGEVEILLKGVEYVFEGRYRFLNNRIILELILSRIYIQNIIMTYVRGGKLISHKIKATVIEEFIERLKNDLDKWVKDYINDYLMYIPVPEDKAFETYSRKKQDLLRIYSNRVIKTLKRRMKDIEGTFIKIPDVSVISLLKTDVHLMNGTITGFNSLHQRSATTDYSYQPFRSLDAIVGFSDLKVSYNYNAMVTNGFPAMRGSIVYTVSDLTALMSIRITKRCDKIKLFFNFKESARPESLIVEGPASRMLTIFKSTFETYILSIMSHMLTFEVNVLGELAKCVSTLPSPLQRYKNNQWVTPMAKEETDQNQGDNDKELDKNDGAVPTNEDEIQPTKGSNELDETDNTLKNEVNDNIDAPNEDITEPKENSNKEVNQALDELPKELGDIEKVPNDEKPTSAVKKPNVRRRITQKKKREVKKAYSRKLKSKVNIM